MQVHLGCSLCCYNVCPTAVSHCFTFFFFNDTATTEIYTLSLHDALPISRSGVYWLKVAGAQTFLARCDMEDGGGGWTLLYAGRDRKSTRLNSSHVRISYAVFCLKKKQKYVRVAGAGGRAAWPPILLPSEL